MVFPMPQAQQPSLARPSSRQEPVTSSVSSQQPLQNEVHPMIQQQQGVRGSNPVVTSIKRSIYTHVNELIAQNEERPEQLARIYHNLQNMNSSEIMATLNNESIRMKCYETFQHVTLESSLIYYKI